VKIRYYSHLQQQTGYGRAARELAAALDIACHRLELRTIGPRVVDWTPPAGTDEVIHDPDAIIVHTLPGDCHRVLELEGLRRGDGPKLVAYTTWEALTAPPEVLQPLVEHFDQVWVPSAATASALATALPRTSAHGEPDIIKVVPHCYDDTVVQPLRVPLADPIDVARFRFYWVGAWTARKNPGGLIRAFALAFGPGSRAELVLHSPGCSIDTFVAALAATGLSQRELPTITLSNQHIPESSIGTLHRESDCFVTAARGEAWNLPAFDAMLAGRHVIAQYGLGSDEFLCDTSADLIDGWESPAQVDLSQAYADDGSITFRSKGAQGVNARSLWLEPNLCSLADAMRSAVESHKRTIKINYNVAERFGYAAVAKQVLNVLEQL
jgi:glycosyltransferase involved in cell wall biosynthesis